MATFSFTTCTAVDNTSPRCTSSRLAQTLVRPSYVSTWREPPRASSSFKRLPRPDHLYVDPAGKCLFDKKYVYYGQRVNKTAAATSLKKKKAQKKVEKRLPVPDHIKGILVDDWENVTRNNQLVPLPHPHPVDQIINDYLEYERPSRDPESPHVDILEETMAGLKEYFEKSLSRILLYRFERPQYHEIRKEWEKTGEDGPKSVCDTYGAEHLCRLIVSLPELVAQTTMDQQSVSRLREEISKFTVWLGKNATKYFVSEYETPAQEYIDRARNI
ncbi:Chromatin modification-related protein eaf3 like [Verticillium longisporum]|uniref:Chromatin modification-related protein EAF3 n=1 Tax=Verticillium longisporum TaxID=100787 RepID=A0A8I2ZRW2_VERLO|nr:hypothetical protein VdG1_00760 [Verticillium dahliae VDG1]KAG7135477.1 Chromatin modification-related protein eaf3 like [Verticillium longisporum]